MQQQKFRDSVVPALVAAGADVNAISTSPENGWSCKGNRTPLILAAEHGDTALMRTLIEAKADQTAVDRSGNTAVELLLAAVTLENGNAEHSLLVSGVDVNTRNLVRIFDPSFVG